MAIEHSKQEETDPSSLTLPFRILNCRSFSLRPNRMKYDFDDELKLGFVVLSK